MIFGLVDVGANSIRLSIYLAEDERVPAAEAGPVNSQEAFLKEAESTKKVAPEPMWLERLAKQPRTIEGTYPLHAGQTPASFYTWWGKHLEAWHGYGL